MKKKTDKLQLIVGERILGDSEVVSFGIDVAQGHDQTAEVSPEGKVKPKRDALGHPWDHLENG